MGADDGLHPLDFFRRVETPLYVLRTYANLFPWAARKFSWSGDEKRDCLQTQAVITGHVCRNFLFPFVFTSVYMGRYTVDNQYPRIRLLSDGIKLLK